MGAQKRYKLASPGQMVDVGGFRLHTLLCGQGTPTVLFESALGGFAQQYAYIQSAVSAFTRVMSYDRAGQGWSDVSPNPRTPVHFAGELTALLGRLDLHPPYVLVGHSFGGLLTQIFAGCHPEEVAGLVLIDSTHADEYNPFPNLDKFVRQMAMGVRLLKFVSRLGLGKQLTKMSLGNAAKSISREDLNSLVTVASMPRHQETMLAEFSQYRFYYGPQSEVPRTLGDIPLIVITAGNSVSGQGKIGSMTGDQMNALHQSLQKNLVQLSSQGEQLIVPGATHLSILFEPEYSDQVIGAIRRVVGRVRKENRLPAPAAQD